MDAPRNENISDTYDRKKLLSDIAKNDECSPSERIKDIDILNKMDGIYIIETESQRETIKLKREEFEFKKSQAEKADW